MIDNGQGLDGGRPFPALWAGKIETGPAGRIQPETIEKGNDLRMSEKIAGLIKLLWAGLGAVLMSAMNCAPAFAAQLIDNAATGDQSVNIMPIVVGLLVVSVLVIVVFLITGAKRKKKKK